MAGVHVGGEFWCAKVMFFLPLCQTRRPEILPFIRQFFERAIFHWTRRQGRPYNGKFQKQEDVTIKEQGNQLLVHTTTVRVRFGDTDPYGIVYFVSYFRYIHRAIEEFLRFCGLRPEETFKNTEEGFGLPIAEAWGRFRRPSRYGDMLRVETRVQEIRAKAILFRFEFFPETGDELLAEGTANLVAIDRTWRSRDLPERVRAALSVK